MMSNLAELAIREAGLSAKSPDKDRDMWGIERPDRNRVAFAILRRMECVLPDESNAAGEYFFPDGSKAIKDGKWRGPDGEFYQKWTCLSRGTQADRFAYFWPSCWPLLPKDGIPQQIKGMKDWPLGVEIDASLDQATA